MQHRGPVCELVAPGIEPGHGSGPGGDRHRPPGDRSHPIRHHRLPRLGAGVLRRVVRRLLHAPIADEPVATALLVLSSFTFAAGLRGARAGRLGSLRRWIVVTIALALGFLGFQLFDWVQAGFSVSSHAYGTMVYAMTGFHGLHVIAGVLLMLVVLGRMAQGAYRDGNVDGPEAVGYYWHFVDIVWIGLYATIFLLR